MAVSIGALFATAAHAQTSVTLYGIADGGVRFDHTTIGTLKGVGSGGESGTRWGLRGTEDLGNGLKANFNFEQGFDLSDNSVVQGNIAATTSGNATSSTGSRIFSRTATVGLSSPQFGELRFGRAYNPYYNLWSAVDPFGGGLAGGAQNYIGVNVGGGAVGSRYDNAIYYDTPKFYGFQLSGAYRLGESTTSTPAAQKNGNNSGNASITYAAGPILAGYSYYQAKNAADNNTARYQFAGGVYDFKVVKLHALFSTSRNETTLHIRTYGAGFTVPYGAFGFYGQVARIDNKFNNNNSTLQNDDSTFFGLGINYAFSKRTDIYTSWAKQKNKNNAVYLVTDASNVGLFTTGATGNVTPGFDPYSYQFGIRHRF